MKIAVIGAGGQAGRSILEEAVDRGHEVTAFVRADSSFSKDVDVVVSDVFALEKNDLNGFDAVVSALAFWAEADLGKHSSSLEHLADILSGTNNRLLVVGGAGSLYVDTDRKLALVDTEDFPAEYKSVAKAMSEGLNVLKNRDDVVWTYFSPAALFLPDAPASGIYALGSDVLLSNANNESFISYADYAVAMIDEIEQANALRARLTAVSN